MRPPKIDTGTEDGISNLRRVQLETIKSQADYTQADAERDYAAGNTKALQAAAYRIADGAAAMFAKKFAGAETWANADWYAAAREHGVEKALGWRPETKHRFATFICKCVDAWADALKYQVKKERNDPHAADNTEVVLEGYELLQEDKAVRQADVHAGEGASSPKDFAHGDAERLNPRDDGERGGRLQRTTRPVTVRYRAPKYDATDEPGRLERFLETIPGPVDRDTYHRWLTGSRPGTRKAVHRYALTSRPKKRFTEADRDAFAWQVHGLWEKFRDFAAQDIFRPPVWDVRKRPDGGRVVMLPRGMTAEQIASRPDLLLSLVAAVDAGEDTKAAWLAAHPGKLPHHFTNEYGQVLYTVKALALPPKPQK